MNKIVSVLPVGISGYGKNYVNALLDYSGNKIFHIAGMVDPKPEGCDRLQEIKERNIPIYSSVEEFYENGNTADLVLISSPIQYHSHQACYALSHGSNVLCEKPIAATVQEAYRMIEERDRSGNLLAIGYQWSFSDAILRLKQDIINGVLGKPKRLKTLILWPRNYNYYSRGWAAKIKDVQGRWILDSIANNATAHYLHNMLFVLGNKIDRSARPVSAKAEVYRANNIENYDTAVIRVYTEEGIELLYYATHAAKELLDPVFHYEFEKAVVNFDCNKDGIIKAKFNDGSVKCYGDPNGEGHPRKMWMMIDSLRRGKKPMPCSVEAALPHLICINGIQEAFLEIPRFPAELVVEDENLTDGCKGRYVNGLNDLLKKML